MLGRSPTNILPLRGPMDLSTPAPGPNLGTLPDELILLVLDQLGTDDYLTLRDFYATSSRYRRLTKDRLYQRFPGCAPEQFLHTIALSPSDERHEFVNHVKEVVWYQNYWDRPSRRRRLPLGDRHAIANKLRSSGAILDTTELSTDLSGRFIGFSSEFEIHWWYLEFFLFFTPKVENITVHDAWQWDDHSYWFKSLAANPFHFANLQSVTVLGPLRLRNIVPLLTLPSIRTLDLTQAVDMREEPGRTFSWAHGGEDYVDRRLANGSSLEILVIRESDLRIPHAVEIFDKLNKVKRFTYEHVYHELSCYPESRLSIFPWVGNMGWGPDSSLEDLRLRVESVVSHDELSSLSHHIAGPVFAKLRTLNIGPCSLETFQGLDLTQSGDLPTIASRIVGAFPDTLESLQIQWAYEGRGGEIRLQLFIDILRYLAEAAACSNSRLKHISIVDWPALAGWFPLQHKVISLKREYERWGMQFDIAYEEIKNEEPLTVMEDVEPDWLWIHYTEHFAAHCGSHHL
ncbi:hypothetical protein G6011_06240 [Alternaria panax]|uniref:F-box domain-containing protein n=1 Tax=Alternaria panax TaxID=48097 RepID=A0AAD4I7Z3_9PLEO|nr:hypothetical protein G6011_06240 [Alternaria panax]